MPAVPLPPDVVTALRRVRRVEQLAGWHGSAASRTYARNATGVLALAVNEAGWPQPAIADVLGLTRAAVQKRIASARRRMAGESPALVFDSALSGPTPRTRTWESVQAREWLKRDEAAAFAEVGESSIWNWKRAGLLPNTRREGNRDLFLKADLTRVMGAAQYKAHGVDYAALRAAIAANGGV